MRDIFTLDYCGYNYRNINGDTIYRPNGTPTYLFLLVLSPMEFTIGGKSTVVQQGACILYTPDTPHNYHAMKEFNNSFFHFFSDDDCLSSLTFPKNEIFYPNMIEEINWLIKKMYHEYLTKQPYFEQNISAYISQLFIQIERSFLQQKKEIKSDFSFYSSFQALRIQLLADCEADWNIDCMCSFVNLEKSRFYCYYKLFFNTTPKADLIYARIDKAKYLLTNDSLPIGTIALSSGFKNVYHFSRYFKKICGCSPTEYAKNPSARL